jgi:hypothetical protein
VGQMMLYHGTNVNFDRFSQDKARIINDFFGGGVAYFTDDIDVALTYAKSMVRSKGGEKLVYEVRFRADNIFDVDHTFSGDEIKRLFKNDKEVEEFARGAGMMKYGVDKYNIISNVALGHVQLRGEEVFKGLSLGMNKTAKAREKLIKLGYDSLRYNGGINMGAKRHSVYIAYKASNISIMKKYMFDAQDNMYQRMN